MPAHRTPRWSPGETAILREHYPTRGIEIAELLSGRSWQSIYIKANKLGLRCERLTDAPESKLRGEKLEDAIRLRETEGWSFARIGAKLGVSEAAACNAVLIALCPRKGFTPAQRDDHGRLTAEGMERLRLALRKGLKGVDIQLRLGVSAACIAEQRRRYARELKARGKAPLPAPGGGAAYSGVKLSRAAKAEVEALFMQGLGSQKVHERTGVSHTSVVRIRARLVRKLARRGEALPGCDARGNRRVQAEGNRFIPEESKVALRAMILDRAPVRRAAALLAIGLCSAYRIRDELAAEMRARGEQLPAPVLPGRVKAGYGISTVWPPQGAEQIFAFRKMLANRTFDEAKCAWQAARREEARQERERPRTFEEQLERIGRGEIGIAVALPRAHLDTTRLRAEEQPARAA